MGDPFDVTSWELPPLALELESIATTAPRAAGAGHGDRAVQWACAHLRDGVAPRALCEAALWCGLRNGRTEGRGPFGLVTHAVLAAHASASLGALAAPGDTLTAALAAVQLCAYTAGSYRGGVNDPAEGPSRWPGTSRPTWAPIRSPRSSELAGSGETDLVDHAWLAAAAADPVAAEQALISAAAAGYQLNEHKLVYPAQLRAWLGDDAALDPVLFRAAARYAGNHLQSADTAETRRADAAALAQMVDAGIADGDHDLERVSVVATGIARTPHHELSPLLLGSLQDELAPEDLVLAIALVTAARFADTSFDPADPVSPVGPIHACTGRTRSVGAWSGRAPTNCGSSWRCVHPRAPPHAGSRPSASCRCHPSTTVPSRTCATRSPTATPTRPRRPHPRCHPRTPTRPPRRGRRWPAAAATDQWMVTHAVKHVVAMHEDFHHSAHPARAWFLAAAARTAAHATSVDQPVAQRADELLG